MSTSDFRRAAHQLADLTADYLESLEHARPASPVASPARPGDTSALLPEHAPQTGEPWDDLLADVNRLIMPGLTHWQHPRFFGYFPCNTTPPAILAEFLSATLNAQGMLWATSPVYTELETRVLDWLVHLLALPERFLSTHATADGARPGGVIQGTASEAALVCMLAARDRTRAAHYAPIERLVAYTSAQAHSSIAKDARIAGLLPDHLRLIPTDAQHRMRPDALARAIEQDLAQNLTPFFACATLGTTSSASVDPLAEIAPITKRHNLWLHVDAAYAGSACVCPEHRWIIQGAEHADSFNFNPHKWLLTTFDCSALFLADRTPVLNALSITPEYLRNKASDSGAVIDYRDWQIPLGRRFRALKLWWVLRSYGVEGLQAHIRRHIQLAERFESLLATDDRFELPCPRMFSLVCFRMKGDDDRTRELHRRLTDSRETVLTHTTLPDATGASRYVLRMAIGGVYTQQTHIDETWALIRRCADAL